MRRYALFNSDYTYRKKEAPPPYGKRIVTINIETEGSDKVSVIFAGRIYEYRDRFQECIDQLQLSDYVEVIHCNLPIEPASQ